MAGTKIEAEMNLLSAFSPVAVFLHKKGIWKTEE